MILQKSPASSRPAPFRRLRRAAAILLVCAASTALFACASALYTIEIRQGNDALEDAAERLQVGMRRREVREILGPPLTPDPFRADKWIYVYRIREARSEWRASPALELFFVDDALARIEKSPPPPAPPQ